MLEVIGIAFLVILAMFAACAGAYVLVFFVARCGECSFLAITRMEISWDENLRAWHVKETDKCRSKKCGYESKPRYSIVKEEPLRPFKKIRPRP